MEKELFDILLKIRKVGNYKEVRSTRSNPKQRETDSEIDIKYTALIKRGLIKEITKDEFIITEYGYDVSNFNNWKDYLEYRKKLIDDRHKKENYDLNISAFQSRNKSLPYYLSGISIVIATLSFLNQCSTKSTENTKEDTELQVSDTLQGKPSSMKIIEKETYKDSLK
jgi:hypothetical protein